MHHHHHHRRHRRHYRRRSPHGFIFPVIFFVIFVSGRTSTIGFILPIIILIIIISIISSAIRNNSSRTYSEQRSSYGSNRPSYQPTMASNTYNSYGASTRNERRYSTNYTSRTITPIVPVKVKISCSSCDIELDSSSKQALDENGFVFCGFCGNKIVR